MQNIGDFLKKFKIIRNPVENRTQVSMIINSNCGIDVSTDNIKIQSGSVYLNIHPIQKTLVFMKKNPILAELQVKLPDLGIKNII